MLPAVDVPVALGPDVAFPAASGRLSAARRATGCLVQPGVGVPAFQSRGGGWIVVTAQPDRGARCHTHRVHVVLYKAKALVHVPNNAHAGFGVSPAADTGDIWRGCSGAVRCRHD